MVLWRLWGSTPGECERPQPLWVRSPLSVVFHGWAQQEAAWPGPGAVLASDPPLVSVKFTVC